MKPKTEMINVLVGTYRKENGHWIKDGKMYNLPLPACGKVAFHESIACIVLIAEGFNTVSYRATFSRIVDSSWLKKHGYKTNEQCGKQKYAIYQLGEKLANALVLSDPLANIFVASRRCSRVKIDAEFYTRPYPKVDGKSMPHIFDRLKPYLKKWHSATVFNPLQDNFLDILFNDQEEKRDSWSFRFVDLFCGVGGFHQAMASLGGQCVFACDINAACRDVYEKNYRNSKDDFTIAADIRRVVKEKGLLPEFDVLCGGFPCQTFSKAGKRNGFRVVENQRGETDDRGQLFFRIIDILKNHPECNYVVLENVRNLADNKDNWDVVCQELKSLGFVITEEPIVESPHNFGIPQVRERVYILGVKEAAIKTDKLRLLRKITKEMLGIDMHHRKCPLNSIPMLLESKQEPKYYLPPELAEVLEIWEEFLQNVKEVKSPFWLHKAGLGIIDDKDYMDSADIGYKGMPEWKKKLVWRSRTIYKKNREFINAWSARHKMTDRILIHQKFEWNASRDCTSMKQGIIQFRQSGVRVKNPDYFPSLVAMNNTPIVWDDNVGKYRYLSPYEAAKLQSFDKDFVFSESDSVSYRQLGNSVNVKLVRLFAEALMKL